LCPNCHDGDQRGNQTILQDHATLLSALSLSNSIMSSTANPVTCISMRRADSRKDDSLRTRRRRRIDRQTGFNMVSFSIFVSIWQG
jgi:hypothetical protein